MVEGFQEMFFPLNLRFKLVPVSKGESFSLSLNTDPQTLGSQTMWVTD